jgi:hypothetical protein
MGISLDNPIEKKSVDEVRIVMMRFVPGQMLEIHYALGYLENDVFVASENKRMEVVGDALKALAEVNPAGNSIHAKILNACYGAVYAKEKFSGTITADPA